MFRRLIREESGQTLVEYGLLISTISIAAIMALMLVGKKARDLFVQANTQVTSTR